jgi:hypothetical protein
MTHSLMPTRPLASQSGPERSEFHDHQDSVNRRRNYSAAHELDRYQLGLCRKLRAHCAHPIRRQDIPFGDEP